MTVRTTSRHHPGDTVIVDLTELSVVNPPVDEEAGEDWAEVYTAAWIAEYGGTDVTGRYGEADYTTWVGDVEVGDTIYRLTALDGVTAGVPLVTLVARVRVGPPA